MPAMNVQKVSIQQTHDPDVQRISPEFWRQVDPCTYFRVQAETTDIFQDRAWHDMLLEWLYQILQADADKCYHSLLQHALAIDKTTACKTGLTRWHWKPHLILMISRNVCALGALCFSSIATTQNSQTVNVPLPVPAPHRRRQVCTERWPKQFNALKSHPRES